MRLPAWGGVLQALLAGLVLGATAACGGGSPVEQPTVSPTLATAVGTMAPTQTVTGEPKRVGFSTPTSVAVTDGGILVAAFNAITGSPEIFVFDASGSFVRSFGQGEIGMPLDVGATGSEVFVLDEAEVLVYDTSGKLQRRFGEDQLRFAGGMWVGTGGVYVTDLLAGKVLNFDVSGKLRGTFSAAELSAPADVGGSAEEIFVSGMDAARDAPAIFVFDAGGQVTRTFGHAAVGLFSLAVEGERIYAVAGNQGNVLVFDLAGNLVDRFGGADIAGAISGLAVGGGRIYAADHLQDCVHVFGEGGEYVGTIFSSATAAGAVTPAAGTGVGTGQEPDLEGLLQGTSLASDDLGGGFTLTSGQFYSQEEAPKGVEGVLLGYQVQYASSAGPVPGTILMAGSDGVVFADVGQAKKGMDQMRRLTETANDLLPDLLGNVEGVSGVSVSEMAFPAIGEDSWAYVWKFSVRSPELASDIDMTMQFAYVRRNRVLLGVLTAQLGETGTSSELERLAQALDDRLRQALE